MTGTAERVTDHELVTGICFFTVETVDTEVVRVIKAASVLYINGSVPPDLFGNDRGIFAEIFGYRLKDLPSLRDISMNSRSLSVRCLWFPGIKLDIWYLLAATGQKRSLKKEYMIRRNMKEKNLYVKE